MEVAVAGLVFVVDTFVQFTKSGALIEDPQCWLVLTAVREENKHGRYPLAKDLFVMLTGSGMEAREVEDALASLSDISAVDGKKTIQLIHQMQDGGMRCLA